MTTKVAGGGGLISKALVTGRTFLRLPLGMVDWEPILGSKTKTKLLKIYVNIMKPIKICLVRVWWSKLMLECKPTAWGMRWNWSEPNFILNLFIQNVHYQRKLTKYGKWTSNKTQHHWKYCWNNHRLILLVLKFPSARQPTPNNNYNNVNYHLFEVRMTLNSVRNDHRLILSVPNLVLGSAYL